jgi:hypothetical protein
MKTKFKLDIQIAAHETGSRNRPHEFAIYLRRHEYEPYNKRYSFRTLERVGAFEDPVDAMSQAAKLERLTR